MIEANYNRCQHTCLHTMWNGLGEQKGQKGCEPWLALENPHQPPKNESAKSCSKSNSILRLEHFLKSCVQCDYEEKEKTMIFEVIYNLGHLGVTLNLTYFKVEVK